MAQCVWWLASIVGLEAGLINYIDTLQQREEVLSETELAKEVHRVPDQVQHYQQIHPDRAPQILRGNAVSAAPRDLTEDQRLERILESAERVIQEFVRDRNTDQRRIQEVSTIPRDIQEDSREDIGLGTIHPDRRNQVQVSYIDSSNSIGEGTARKESVTLSSPLTKRQYKELNKRESLLSRVKAGKVKKSLSRKQRSTLGGIPKDTIYDYLQERK